MIKWRDQTAHRQGDEERIPRIWEGDIEGIRPIVHRLVHCKGWYLTLRDLGINSAALKGGEDIEVCNAQALIIIKRTMQAKMDIMSKAIAVIDKEVEC